MALEKITSVTGRAVHVPGADIDTDRIIPARFMKCVTFDGLGEYAFYDVRFNFETGEKTEHPLNESRFDGASILLAGVNFGCGSSREHAPWAIADYGFNTIISTSFADIFYSNCFKNSILPLVVDSAKLAALMSEITANEGVQFSVDLENQKVTTPAGNDFDFEVEAFRKHNMLNGLDDIGLTLKNEDKITAFEERQKKELPWLWKQA